MAAFPFGGWYYATKFAAEGFSDALCMELAPFGIDVIVVEPGGIKTDWGIIAAEHLKQSSANGAYAAQASRVAEGMMKNIPVRIYQILKDVQWMELLYEPPCKTAVFLRSLGLTRSVSTFSNCALTSC